MKSVLVPMLGLFGMHCAAQSSPATLTTILNFPTTVGQPETGVLTGAGGVLYGTAAWPQGTIFSLTPPVSGRGWTYNQIYQFPTVWVNGAGYSTAPNSLTMDSSGVLYGTNFDGGNLTGGCIVHLTGCGSVFALNPPSSPGGAWTETTLYEFTGGDDGAAPGAGVTIGPGGVLYGTAEMKGASDFGTLFSLTPPRTPGGAWTEATLHTFGSGTDGRAPASNLAIDSNGVLYGTTNYGGAPDRGSVYSLAPPAAPGGVWTETVLFEFPGGAGGSVPNGGVLPGPGGVLYGSLKYGGPTNGGAVYALTPPADPGGAWTQSVLHSFPTIGAQGPYPGPLAWGAGGQLYGTTYQGGVNHLGSIFALTPPAADGSPWGFYTVYSLTSETGSNPTAGFYTGGELLAVGASGMIYGTTGFGGSNQYYGTVFALHP